MTLKGRFKQYVVDNVTHLFVCSMRKAQPDCHRTLFSGPTHPRQPVGLVTDFTSPVRAGQMSSWNKHRSDKNPVARPAVRQAKATGATDSAKNTAGPRTNQASSALRNACCSRSHSDPVQSQRFNKTPRTCLEGPFGEVLRATGPMAKVNPIRFSSKYQDDETDLLYYGHRYYNASSGRWLNRDPEEEDGGVNLLACCDNNLLNSVDPLGLVKVLRIAVAQDVTIPNTEDKYYEKKLDEKNEDMRGNLKDTLSRCKDCPAKFEVVLVPLKGIRLPAPKTGVWHSHADEDLMRKNWKKITPAGKGGVPVFWTMKGIEGTAEHSAAGVGYFREGIILSYNKVFPLHHLLAHELGHFVGYSGGDVGRYHEHSSDVKNVMNAEVDGSNPDEDWCNKVLELMQEL